MDLENFSQILYNIDNNLEDENIDNSLREKSSDNDFRFEKKYEI